MFKAQYGKHMCAVVCINRIFVHKPILSKKNNCAESDNNFFIIKEKRIKIVKNQSDVFLCGENCESHLARMRGAW